MNIDFTRFTWFTPNQLRDTYLATSELTTDNVHLLRLAALNEQARRKTLPLEFVECPRCKGYHGQLSNVDNLCEKCAQLVHMLEWDKSNLRS